jgi:hypothetical protein
MKRLGLLLCLVISARAGDDPLVRVYDLADLKTHDNWYALAMVRVKDAAAGAEVRPEGDALVVVAPAAVQEKVARELETIRESFGRLVGMEVRFLRVEGGLGVASVAAEKLDALLEQRKAEAVAAPKVTCYNGQQASISVARQLSYVRDFTFTADNEGNVTADSVVDTLPDGVTANLRPFIAEGKVRVAADVTVAEVADRMPEIDLPLPLAVPAKIQFAEGTTRSVRKLVDCAPGEYAVLDLGGGCVVLIRATPLALKGMRGLEFEGKEIELK